MRTARHSSTSAPVRGSRIDPRCSVCERSAPLLPPARKKISFAMRSASGPESRTIATPPSPGGVATAAMVSSRYMEPDYIIKSGVEDNGGMWTDFLGEILHYVQDNRKKRPDRKSTRLNSSHV